jgi:hypothetical protein
MRVQFNVDVSELRACIPLFEMITAGGSNPIIDTKFNSVMYFQFGLLYPAVNAATGLPERIPFKFGGANYWKFDPAVHDVNDGRKYSDTLRLGFTIPKNTPVEIWTAVELPAGSYNNALPCSVMATNYLDRWVCQSFASTSGIIGAGNGAASDVALTATSLTKLGTTQTGVTGIFTPLVQVRVPNRHRRFVIMGDSIGQSVNEGGSGSSTLGDTMGDALGNCTLHDRGLFNVLHQDFVNLSKGSDGSKFLNTLENWKLRAQLLADANPHYIIDGCIHNDISASITISGYATGAVTKYLVRSANSAMWMAENAGTGTTTPTGGADGSTFVDNDVTWYKIPGGFPATASQRGFGQIFAWKAAQYDLYRSICPNARIISMLGTPDANGATPSTNFEATSASRRGRINALLASKPARLGIYATLNPSTYLENGQDNGTWVTGMNADTTHPNSVGHDAGSAAYGDVSPAMT